MSLHNGIDTIAIATVGVFTKNYGSAEGANIANLLASLGFLEDAPEVVISEDGLSIVGVYWTIYGTFEKVYTYFQPIPI